MSIRVIKKEVPVTPEDVRKLQETVSSILDHVKQEGDQALRSYMKKFDHFEPESFLVTPEDAAREGIT